MYGCRFATNGYFATQTKYQQTDFITDGKPVIVREKDGSYE
jgi:hypothetical protein